MQSDGVELAFAKWPDALDGRRQSLWFSEAIRLEPEVPVTPLDGSAACDVCIVGGGFTGLWTGIRLKEHDPALRVIVLEADRCGTGASGRNSGGVGHWWTKLPMLVRLVGKDRAVRFVQASVDAVADIDNFVKAHGIECLPRHDATMLAATNPSQFGAWDAMFRVAEELGVQSPYRRMQRDELIEKVGDGPYLDGIIDERAMRIQPAMLVRGLLRTARELGCEVYERTPVERIRSRKGDILVKAGGHEIAAQKVVLASYAWMAHLPELRDRVSIVRSDIAATAPIPQRLERLGLRNRPNVMTMGQIPNYGGVTQDGRVYTGRGAGALAFNARIGPVFDGSDEALRAVEKDFHFLYPQLSDVPATVSWSGPIDMTAAGLPWFDHLREDRRIFYGIGYTGHGVCASAIGGRVLAAKVLERDDPLDDLSETLSIVRGGGTYPAEPIRFIGGTIVKAAVARKELALRTGRKPGQLDVMLSKLATPPLKISKAARA